MHTNPPADGIINARNDFFWCAATSPEPALHTMVIAVVAMSGENDQRVGKSDDETIGPLIKCLSL
jgi:hypothetical protein